jgi:hypothetical protein
LGGLAAEISPSQIDDESQHAENHKKRARHHQKCLTTPALISSHFQQNLNIPLAR